MHTFNLYWAPEGRKIATVRAHDAKAAKRKAPQPYRKFLGEIYATEVLDCGHEPSPHTESTTGYGEDADGKRHCYACSADREKARMIETGRAVLYLMLRCGAVNNDWHITYWPGVLDFTAYNITRSYGSAFGRRYPIVTGRFRGPDGKVWAFRNQGDQQLARCRRLKDPR